MTHAAPPPVVPSSRADASLDDDHFHDECGVFGVYNHPNAAALTALGLHALQHRGQEAAGIVSYDETHFHSHRALGVVGDNFNSEDVINQLPGTLAVGHVRYSTSGGTLLRNVQPLFADLVFGGFAIAHNGNLTNAHTCRHELVENGCIFQSTSDTETFLHLIATSHYRKVLDRLTDALNRVQGAYSLVALTRRKLIGVRDPLGVRPLVLGRVGDAWVMASETCALDIIGADYVRDVEPGEIVVISEDGLKSIKPFPPQKSRFCIFEHIYFARPDSVMDGRSVYGVRKEIGAELARESHVEADMVVPVPDSGVPAAIGYARQSGIPFELGIIRNHYVGRTFIQPGDHIRHLGVKLKHNANTAHVKGKRVVLVDDSIVRGTTSVKIVEMMRAAGAKEIHMRISSPPTTHPCYYGIDTPDQDQLMAHKYSIAQMAAHIGVDTLAFISHDGLYRALGEEKRDADCPQYCDACFTGDYAIPLVDHNNLTEPQQLSLLAEKV
ncbi:amidophosphoribosyltransferase [Varunaivibrio sulfuroxidans]|uniref:Amidophosphoribosyltransferase n=1 Tax=Varunaivibrio sulfuroxidans TaxID=1773489 RepID=A0A4R3J6Q7_9PROT|nr:amidophosphoribosyltransferase [Varunaivibrio sulfuroxidans]TCS60140.1 amidophosphoribosyltransferase [Varunaivibrio sulfuroxidans]WES30888.1 amidophosphoribosyltransferase [Varunaivibrio sulfuroxidans]